MRLLARMAASLLPPALLLGLWVPAEASLGSAAALPTPSTLSPDFSENPSFLAELPFGEKWNPQPGNQPLRFTGKERPLRYIDPDGREEISVMINTFIPHSFITTPWPMRGDARGPFESGTSRTSQTVVVETDPAKSASGFVRATAETGESLGLGDHGILTRGKASTEGLNVSVSRDESGDVWIHATGSVAYPNLPSFPITYDLNVTVSDRQGQVAVGVGGAHARFPGFEILAQREGSQARQGVYQRTPGRSQMAPLTIFGGVPVNEPPKRLEDK